MVAISDTDLSHSHGFSGSGSGSGTTGLQVVHMIFNDDLQTASAASDSHGHDVTVSVSVSGTTDSALTTHNHTISGFTSGELGFTEGGIDIT